MINSILPGYLQELYEQGANYCPFCEYPMEAVQPGERWQFLVMENCALWYCFRCDTAFSDIPQEELE